MNTLILGIGNEILTDDGIGPKLVKALQSKLRIPGVVYRTTALGGLETLEEIKDFDDVVVIDAIRTEKGKPGDIYTFTPEDFRETLHLSNLHDVNFLTALEMGRKLGIKVPREIQIIAIEVAEDQVFSNEFSPQIKLRYTHIEEKVGSLVLRILGSC